MKHLLILFSTLFKWMGFGKIQKDLDLVDELLEDQKQNGIQNGKGTYTWSNGNEYVGEWKDGKEHGQGTYTFTEDRNYDGEWKNGKYHGQGT